MLGTGYFLKITNINSQQENQFVLITKISFRKTKKKSPIRKNKLPQKFFQNIFHTVLSLC